ncbi:DUF1293 domain-containing protein [Vibrio sp. PID23_8]|uniref:DUF1293 domain-containing protein n=1 Tax=Vibrio sp. PID23_8 TaxID=1583767 RepID=UPI000E69B5C2|nr:DUF1293 domain-containing protein [Vibrio sp. PID23_8]RIZ55156.1 VSK-int [Vibrio sp. PID23_8]
MAVITAVVIKCFPKSGMEIAELSVLRNVETVDVEKFKQYGIGLNTDIPFNKQPIRMNLDYAKKLIDTRAFVPNKEYDLRFDVNIDDPLDVQVKELIPQDDAIKKHFADSMK